MQDKIGLPLDDIHILGNVPQCTLFYDLPAVYCGPHGPFTRGSDDDMMGWQRCTPLNAVFDRC